MLFIITGPDGSGKTTLAKQMSKQMGGEIMHFSYPRSKQEKEKQLSMYQEIIEQSREKNVPCFLEHAWYSEMAYGPVKRNRSYIDWSEMYLLERDVISFGGGVIVYCTGLIWTMYNNAVERGEKYITSQEDYMQICANFDNIMKAPHHLPVLRYSYASL